VLASRQISVYATIARPRVSDPLGEAYPEATAAARLGLSQPNRRRQPARRDRPVSTSVRLHCSTWNTVSGVTAFKSHLTVPLVPTRNPTTEPSLHLQCPSQRDIESWPQGAAISLVDRRNHKESASAPLGQPASTVKYKSGNIIQKLAIKLH